VGEVVVVEQLRLARDVDLDAREHLLHVVEELVREVLAAGPLGQAERLLLGDRRRRALP
jgi:hypothetical protein